MNTQLYSMNDLIRHSQGKTHFFDADSKRFFNSRIGQNLYLTPNPFLYIFTTSERCDWSDRYEWQLKTSVNEYGTIYTDDRYVRVGENRGYSIRSYDSRTGNIETIGEFNSYSSSQSVNRSAKKYADNVTVSVDDLHEFAIGLNEEFDQTNRRRYAGYKAIIANGGGMPYVAQQSIVSVIE